MYLVLYFFILFSEKICCRMSPEVLDLAVGYYKYLFPEQNDYLENVYDTVFYWKTWLE